eukprot:ANDGO_05821.mRNA.1 putative membrane protein YJR124C
MLKIELGYVGCVLFLARFLRLFAYGVVAVVLLLYLSALGFESSEIGTLLFLTLFGDAFITVTLTAKADRFIGRKVTLVIGAVLMCLSGLAFSAFSILWVLVLAATIGVISPAGGEIGPFLAVEQAALTQIVSNDSRTAVFSWQNLVGVGGQALGAVVGSWMVQSLMDAHDWSSLDAYRACFYVYALIGAGLALLYIQLPSGRIEITSDYASLAASDSAIRHFSNSDDADDGDGGDADDRDVGGRHCWSLARMYARVGLPNSGSLVAKISCLFSLDAFAGGLVLQSILVYWFHIRYGLRPQTLGIILFFVNLIAAGSSLAAVPLSKRFGLVNTMVFTHLPSHVLLVMVPLMPNVESAVSVLLLRFTISQMDVPTRQSYVAAVVDPTERSAAAGMNTLARSLGSAVGPLVAGWMMQDPSSVWFDIPFFLAAVLKTIYDLLLRRSFLSVKAVEERVPDGRREMMEEIALEIDQDENDSLFEKG